MMATLSSNRTKAKVARRFTSNERFGRYGSLLILLLPAVVIFTVFVVLPVIGAGWMGFYKYKGYGPLVDFVGVSNYINIVTKRTFNVFFEPALRNTALLLAASLFLQLPLALLCALMLYKESLVNSVFRLILFLPFILSEIASGLIWTFMLDGRDGVLAPLFTALLGKPYFILADKTWGFAAVLLVLIWKYFGYHMIIYIAGLQGVPKELLESAEIDGASNLQSIFYIKIPLISHALKLSIFFALLGSLQVFDLIIGLFGASPPETAQTFSTFIYEWGLSRRQQYGIASAASVMLFAICMIVGFAYQYFVMGEQSMFRRRARTNA
jgi:raffinose/stachyose/melibiose transport system permease protein